MKEPKFTPPPFITVGMTGAVSRWIVAAIDNAIACEQVVTGIRALTNTTEAEVVAAAQADPHGLAGVRARALRGEWP